MYRSCIVLIFCVIGAFGDLEGIRHRRGIPSVSPGKASSGANCKKDLVLIVDTSYSVGEADFEANVKPFLINLVTSSLLNVEEYGTQIGLILFSSQDKTKIMLNMGESLEAEKVKQYIKNLKWSSVSGDRTRTELALKLANEMLPNVNPLNNRPEIDDVVVLITDGEPRGKSNTLELTKKYANDLKNKKVRVITAGVGRQSEQPEFIKILKELATSPDFFLKAQFDKMDDIMSTLVAKSCVQPGECSCDGTIEVDETIQPGKTTAKVAWPKPEYSCASGGKVTDVNTVVQPDVTSPHEFSWGTHDITYAYTLNGGVTIKCPVIINVRGDMCCGIGFDSSNQVCCCCTIHSRRSGHACCRSKYYDTSSEGCCENGKLIPYGQSC